MKIKTCLRYPGGKFYGFKFLKNLLETPHEEYREPFIGGGSVFLGKELVKKNWINDKDTNLINFYEVITNNDDREALFKKIRVEVVNKKRYAEVLNFIPSNKIERAFKYFYLNRTSFSGIMNKPRWGYRIGSSVTPENWESRILPVSEKLKKTKITSMDFREVIGSSSKNLLVYLDPPYFKVSKKIYSEEFSLKDHYDLHDILRDAKFKFILSYNDNEELKKLYFWASLKSEEWIYFMSEQRRQQGKELIITNF